MDSLYGGHQGNSFTLRAEFASVGEMVAAFKGGPNYTNVWYDEFVIINTKNKNDKDNGKIFRRGYDYQNSMGGAIQVGQVVGPSSGTPYFSIGGLESVTKQTHRDLKDNEYRRYPIDYDKKNNKYITTEAKGDPKYFDFGTPVDLVPGKTTNNDGEVEYNDTIKYTWCNIRNDNADSDSWFYVGWQIPYSVIDYTVHSKSPYDEHILTNTPSVTRIDDRKHPYYAKWNIGVPHGIKGDALRNLRVIVPTNEDKIYPCDAIKVDKDTGIASLDTEAKEYPNKGTDVANHYQIVVFDYYTFDDRDNPTPYMIYLGAFNTISGITLDPDGTLTITYTSQSSFVRPKAIRWIDSITLNTDPQTREENADTTPSGRFTVNFNDNTSFTTRLQWLHDITINEDGAVTYNYVGTAPVTVDKQLSWLKKVELDENGHMTIFYNNDRYNTNSQQDFYLKWVKDIVIADDGTITFQYTGGKNDISLKNIKIKNIIKATASDEGVITFTYNTKHQENGKDVNDTITLKTASSVDNQEVDFKIKTIKNVSLGSGLSEDKHIKITYNTPKNLGPVPIGPSLNYIADMIVRPTDWHLLVLYGDPEHRPTSENIDSFPGKWVHGPELSAWSDLMLKDIKSTGTVNGIYWCDLGTIKDQAGILIGFNLTNEQLRDGFNIGDTHYVGGYENDPLNWLEKNLSNGLDGKQNMPGGAATKGKLVTYTPPAVDGVQPGAQFYAYDYNTGHWFLVGTISDNGTRDVGWALASGVKDAAKKLNTQGLMFYQNVISVSTDALPQFWAIN